MFAFEVFLINGLMIHYKLRFLSEKERGSTSFNVPKKLASSTQMWKRKKEKAAEKKLLCRVIFIGLLVSINICESQAEYKRWVICHIKFKMI